jgi:hypothetical protein
LPRLVLAASGFIPEGAPGVMSTDPRFTAAPTRASAPGPEETPAPAAEAQPQAAPEPESPSVLRSHAPEPEPESPFGFAGVAGPPGGGEGDQPPIMVMPVFSFLRMLGGAGLNVDLGAMLAVGFAPDSPMDLQVGLDVGFGAAGSLEAYPTEADGTPDYLASKESRDAKFTLLNMWFAPIAFHADVQAVRLVGGVGMAIGFVLSPTADTSRAESLGGVMPVGLGPGFNFGVMGNIGGVAWVGGQWRYRHYFLADFDFMSLDVIAAF